MKHCVLVVTPEGKNWSVKDANKPISLNMFHLDFATASEISEFQKTLSMNAFSEGINHGWCCQQGFLDVPTVWHPSVREPAWQSCPLHVHACLFRCRWLMMPDRKGREWTQMYTRKSQGKAFTFHLV